MLDVLVIYYQKIESDIAAVATVMEKEHAEALEAVKRRNLAFKRSLCGFMASYRVARTKL